MKTTKIGIIVIAIVLTNLINTCIEGPEVSFVGSPTVSPITADLIE